MTGEITAAEMARRRWRKIPAAQRKAMMAAAGRKGGRRPIPTACRKCGAMCESVRASLQHCRRTAS